MLYETALQVYYIALIVFAIAGILKFRNANNTIRVIIIFIAITAVAENIAHYMALKYNYNLIVFHIYDPIKFILLSIFFNNVIPSFKRKNIGLKIGLACVLISILNSLFIQTPEKYFNNYFSVFESIVIVLLCLLYFYEYLKQKESINNRIPTSFYIVCMFLVFWSFTMLYWFIQPFTSTILSKYNLILRYSLLATNFSAYTILTILILKHKPLKQ